MLSRGFTLWNVYWDILLEETEMHPWLRMSLPIVMRVGARCANMIEVVTVDHSAISTVKLWGKQMWSYLNKYFAEVFNVCRIFWDLTSHNIDLALCWVLNCKLNCAYFLSVEPLRCSTKWICSKLNAYYGILVYITKNSHK